MRFDLSRVSVLSQEAPAQHHPRAPVVPAGRHQHRLPQGEWGPHWDEWADENGDLGPVYGYQWRSWPNPGGGHTDHRPAHRPNQEQPAQPAPRECLESSFIEEMALPPCHCLLQFHVQDGRRAASSTSGLPTPSLGVPFNIASYALLTMTTAQVCDLELGDFVHTFGDVHLYLNHVDQAREQLTRDTRELPVMRINPDVRISLPSVSRTSSSSTTTPIRTSRRPSRLTPTFAPCAFPHCGRCGQRCHRKGQRPDRTLRDDMAFFKTTKGHHDRAARIGRAFPSDSAPPGRPTSPGLATRPLLLTAQCA